MNATLSYFIISKNHFINYTIYTILQYSQHLNFYFPIPLIKIIFLHNKIISHNHHHLQYKTTITTSPPLNYTHLIPPPPVTHNLLSAPTKKKKKHTHTHTQKPTVKPIQKKSLSKPSEPSELQFKPIKAITSKPIQKVCLYPAKPIQNLANPFKKIV